MHASIRSYAGHELEIDRVLGEHAYEIRYGDSELAWLGDPAFSSVVQCVTRDGEWTFEWLRGGKTEARLGTAVVARYGSGLFPGGRIRIGEEVSLKLRPPPPLGRSTWRVQRGREALIDFHMLSDPRRIAFSDAARYLESLPLLTTFALHALLVEQAVPGAVGGGDGGGM